MLFSRDVAKLIMSAYVDEIRQKNSIRLGAASLGLDITPPATPLMAAAEQMLNEVIDGLPMALAAIANESDYLSLADSEANSVQVIDSLEKAFEMFLGPEEEN